MKQTIILLLIFCSYYCNAQNKDGKSLIAFENKVGKEGSSELLSIVRYNFEKGILISKDTLFNFPQSRGKQRTKTPRFDLGRNIIYKNRYLISCNEMVLDLKIRKLFTDVQDEFIDTTGDSIIFKRSYKINGNGYYILNLKDLSYNLVKDVNYRNVKGYLSPDYKHGLVVDQHKLPFQILLNSNKNDSIVIVKDCGTGTKLSFYSSSFPNLPLLWLDNNHFLYAKFSNNVEIRKVSIDTKSETVIGVIDSILPSVSISNFFIDKNNEIRYSCAMGTFKIDDHNKTLKKTTRFNNGNDFSSDLDWDKDGVSIHYKNDSIGKLWCLNYRTVTSAQYIAVEYGEPGSNLGDPKGIKIWNVDTKKWITIDLPWLGGLIGWVE